jgi:hypothetical protein
MNQNNSYVVPNYPQLTNNIEQNQQMMPNKQNLNTQEQKHLLFFSNYCNHCKNLLSELEKKTVIQNIQLICIDNRQIIDNIIYINLQNGSKMPLPPMINSVPSLCLVPNYEILTGMFHYLNQSKMKEKK